MPKILNTNLANEYNIRKTLLTFTGFYLNAISCDFVQVTQLIYRNWIFDIFSIKIKFKLLTLK